MVLVKEDPTKFVKNENENENDGDQPRDRESDELVVVHREKDGD